MSWLVAKPDKFPVPFPLDSTSTIDTALIRQLCGNMLAAEWL
jgi:hypothetical protein